MYEKDSLNFREPLPLSVAQSEVWRAQLLTSDPAFYNVGGYVEIEAPTEAKELEAAIRQALSEVDTYHLVVQETADGPRQCIVGPALFELPVIDLTGSAQPSAAARAWMQASMSQPFDLSAGPLFSYALLKLEKNRSIWFGVWHHLIADAIGGALFMRRVARLYTDLIAGTASEHEAITSWVEFLKDEAEYGQSARCQKDQAYWRQQLIDRPPVVTLSGAAPIRSGAVIESSGVIAGATVAQMRLLGAAHNASLAVVMLAMTAAYVFRMTGARDLILGMPVTGRTSQKLRRVVGFLSNVVPVRLQVDPEAPFLELLRQAGVRTREAFRHQRYWGGAIRRDLAMTPNQPNVYGIVFNFVPNDAEVEVAGRPVRLTIFTHTRRTEDVSITVEARNDDSDIAVRFSARQERYDATTLDHHQQRFLHVVDSILRDPTLCTGSLSMLSEAERSRVVYGWNDTAAPWPERGCLHELIERQVRRSADAVAVTCEDRRLTYSQLNADANRLARYLRQRGVSPGSNVALVMQRSDRVLVALLGVLKAGAACVPLDPGHPQSRLAFMLSDSAAVMVLTDSGLQQKAAAASCSIPLIVMDVEHSRWQSCSENDLSPAESPRSDSSLAYVIYTSGTTGEPKGVAVEHRNLVHSTAARVGYYQEAIGAFLLLSQFSFDSSIAGIFWTLSTGGTLVVPTDDAVHDLHWLGKLASVHGATHLLCVPSLYAAMLEHIPSEAFSTLKTAIVAGEACSRVMVQAHARKYKDVRLYNEYGPTECSVWATVHRCEAGEAGAVPIGRPIRNARIYLLNEQGMPAPAGASAEIYIGGAGVARGYLNRPDETALRFMSDPFAAPPCLGNRMYRTGDLGRWRSDGVLEFLGRADQQVKIRGHRIELGEVEAALAVDPGIREAAAVACEDKFGGKYIAAYVVLRSGFPDIRSLRTALGARLPDHMMPTAYVFLDRLPRSPNGKLDREALPPPANEPDAFQATEEVLDAQEAALAALWSELLNTKQVRRHDNFFELGGNSLLAITLFARMRERGWHVDPRAFFDQPSVAQQAAAIQGQQAPFEAPKNRIPQACARIEPHMLPLVELTQMQIDRVAARVPGGCSNVQDIYPLAPLQEGILLHHRLAAVTDAYVLRLLLEFDTADRLEAFITALQSVIERHDVLRTAIQWDHLPQAVQVVWRSAPLSVDRLPASGGESELERLWSGRLARMDLGQAPLIRATVAQNQAGNGTWLLIRLHHLILDHTTLDLILEEVRAILDGHAVQHTQPPAYRNFVAQSRLAREDSDHEVFFRQQLAGVDRPTAPFGLLDVFSDGVDIAEAQLQLEPRLAQQLRIQAKRLGVAPASLFHLAWGLVVAKASARTDVVFDTVLFGRMRTGVGMDMALGLFINTLPLRLQLDRLSAADAVRYTHARLAELLRHEHASLAQAQRCSPLAAGTPLSSALFNYRYDRNRGSLAQEVDALTGVKLLRSEEGSNYPLTLSVDDFGTGFGLTVLAPAAVRPAEIAKQAQGILENLERALDQAPHTAVLKLAGIATDRSGSAAAQPIVLAPRVPIPKANHHPPQSAVEVRLAEIWRQVLPVKSFDRRDDFFALGGHSLTALQVASRVRDAFGFDLPMKSYFDARVLSELAAEIEQAMRSQQSSTAETPIEPVAVQGPMPLSYSQERMWLIQTLNPDTTAYNMAAGLRIRGHLNLEALSFASAELLARHEILRTRIRVIDDQPRQVVEAADGSPLCIIDLRALPQGGAEVEALRRAVVDARTPFDLAGDAVVRMHLYLLNEDTNLLTFVVHHIAGDQWSMGILGRELATLYNARRAATPASLPQLSVSYRDFAHWERSGGREREFERQIAYWRQQLDDVPTLNIPTDHPRPKAWTLNGAFYDLAIPPQLFVRLREVADGAGATMFMILFAAFAVLLRRITSQTDIAIGVPVANRTHSVVEALVGTFVNTLVLRVDLSGDPDFQEVLQRVRALALEAFANQDVSFDRLVQEIGQRVDRSRAPLTQVLFNVANAPMHGLQFIGLEWEPVEMSRGGAQFELSVSIDTEVTGKLSVEYNTDLFLPGTVQRMVDQYMTILEAVIAAPACPISALPILPQEQLDALRAWNATQAQFADGGVFPRMFEAQTARSPEAIAIRFKNESMSYAELNSKANSFARELQRCGAQPGVIVAVCAERSTLLLIALLAVQKTGAAYLPLDPQFPPERLKYMLEHSGAAVLVVCGGSAGAVPEGVRPKGVRILDVAEVPASPQPQSKNLEGGPGAEDTAYVIYTSGSTGRPKGVAIPHRALTNFLCSMRERPGLNASDVLAAVTTVSFDIAALELYLPLLVGARIELVPRATAADGDALAKLLKASGANVLQATPATWRLLLETDWEGGARFRALSGGEAISRPLADSVLERVGELWNLYGPTETTVWSTVERVERGTAISIGRGIANTQVHIVDAAGALVPIGVTGEICIGGAGVALGYHGQPDLTAERFIPDLYSALPNKRLYRTGDLGRWVEGKIQHLGRQDSQVKIRGFRIELGEIEQVLAAHTAILQVAVLVREARADDPRLVAYVVFRHGQDLTTSEMKLQLRSQLPDYMIPALFVALHSMPLTPNGKLDRNALPDPFSQARDGADAPQAPMSANERLIAELWKQVLRVESVDPTANFFELGGYSLLSLRVMKLIEMQTGYRMDPRVLFFHNLREVAALLEPQVAHAAIGSA